MRSDELAAAVVRAELEVVADEQQRVVRRNDRAWRDVERDAVQSPAGQVHRLDRRRVVELDELVRGSAARVVLDLVDHDPWAQRLRLGYVADRVGSEQVDAAHIEVLLFEDIDGRDQILGLAVLTPQADVRGRLGSDPRDELRDPVLVVALGKQLVHQRPQAAEVHQSRAVLKEHTVDEAVEVVVDLAITGRAEQRMARGDRHRLARKPVYIGPDVVVEHAEPEVPAKHEVHVPAVHGPAPGSLAVAVHEVVLGDVIVVVQDRLDRQVVDRRRQVDVVEDEVAQLGTAEVVEVDRELEQVGVVLVEPRLLLVQRLQIRRRTSRGQIVERLVARRGRAESVARDPVGVRRLEVVVQPEERTVALDPHRKHLVVRCAGGAESLPAEDLPDERLVGVVALEIEGVGAAAEQSRSHEVVPLGHEELPRWLHPRARPLPADTPLYRVVQPAVEEQHDRLGLLGEAVIDRGLVIGRVDEPVEDR